MEMSGMWERGGKGGKMVCDSLNMCKERENFTRDGLELKKVPNFCPWCGKKWYTSAMYDVGSNRLEEKGND